MLMGNYLLLNLGFFGSGLKNLIDFPADSLIPLVLFRNRRKGDDWNCYAPDDARVEFFDGS